MHNSSKNKTLIFIIGFLLLTNIGMVIFIWRMKKEEVMEPPKRKGFSERIRKEVKFDSLQLASFEVRKKAHWDKMRVMFDTMTATKGKFYHLLYDSLAPDSLMRSQAEIIGRQQKELDLHVISYFKDVRKLCKPVQLATYDSLLPDIIKRMTEPPWKK